MRIVLMLWRSGRKSIPIRKKFKLLNTNEFLFLLKKFMDITRKPIIIWIEEMLTIKRLPSSINNSDLFFELNVRTPLKLYNLRIWVKIYI